MTTAAATRSGEELIDGAVAHAVELLAAPAITAPKSEGQLFLRGGKSFIETTAVMDKEVQQQLADWMRARGR
jgi:hypothetical protein